MKKVLIAHQSTIPHYRVPFYNMLNKMRPIDWQFEVVFDPNELITPTYFKEKIEPSEFDFPIYEVRTFQFSFLGSPISYQTFINNAGNFDLIVLENAVNNITYPLCHIHKLFGKKVAYWGHGKDRHDFGSSIVKKISEKVKIFLVQEADAFFAYSQGVSNYLTSHGIPKEKIFVLNNTIDINFQREKYQSCLIYRNKIRKEYNLEDKKILLFVGRFTENKRVKFLINSFRKLKELDEAFHLLMVGSGGESYYQQINHTPGITCLGSIIDSDELAPIYLASDLFVFPGSVGLGPLQALCYDLPVITIDSPFHMPEIEYLSTENSLILSENTNPEAYAKAIFDLFEDQVRLKQLKSNAWSSIQHLTIEAMAKNFINGINTILEL